MNDIIRQIQRGYCVPFLGAGANVACPERDYPGLPLGTQLAARIYQELELDRRKAEVVEELMDRLRVDLDQLKNWLLEYHQDPEHLPEPPHFELLAKLLGHLGFQYGQEYDLAHLSLELDAELGRPGLNRFLKDQLRDEECEPSPLLKTLAGLPSLKLIITTNYDRLMEKALEQEGRQEGVDFKVVTQKLPRYTDGSRKGALAEEITEQVAGFDGLILYKIHGSFSDRLPGILQADALLDEGRRGQNVIEKLIITEDDYIEFLGVIGHAELGLPNVVKTKLKHSTLMFLGYSLEDWDFRVAFKTLVEPLGRHQQEKSYAFQKNPRDSWVDYWDDKEVVIFDVDLYEFADGLAQRFREQDEQ
jgi:hypothetical protein